MRFNYYKRILRTYLGGGKTNLSFWHEEPAVNEGAFAADSRQYFMTFADKARYAGPFDDAGIPLLDYKGTIGQQYNPIAIAQYGLGCWNEAEKSDGDESTEWMNHAKACADWLVSNLEQNPQGQWVWNHKFDWDYYQTLKSPWYSGLAQGMGISLLVRVSQLSEADVKYADAADKAAKTMLTEVKDGGTLFIDEDGDWWIEEYITEPLTHILNGFMWAMWGVRDYVAMRNAECPSAELRTGGVRNEMAELWDRGLQTLAKKTSLYDSGYWSLYDLAPVRMKNPASPFYHKLHLVQLEVMSILAASCQACTTIERWKTYQSSKLCRTRALISKAIFKLLYF